jgi:tetratricopeptide (TPR) repeat protein
MVETVSRLFPLSGLGFGNLQNWGNFRGSYGDCTALLPTEITAAEPVIRKALELAPTFGPDHFILAWVLVGLNRTDEAERNAHEALARDPSLALAHLLLANIFIRRGDYSTALVELDAYLRLNPDGPLSDQVCVARESLERKVARSLVIVATPLAKP